MARIAARAGAALALCLAAAAAQAQAPAVPDNAETLTKIGVELGKFAIVVVIVESALSALFNWRVWRDAFNSRSLKTPVMFAAGLIVVLSFRYDVFNNVMSIVTGNAYVPGTGSAIISAMILAGGSSGINTLFRNLGLRSPLPDTPEVPKPDKQQAWVSVLVDGAKAGNDFAVSIKDSPKALADLPQLAGSIRVETFMDRLKGAFGADTRRFPTYGGHLVDANRPYLIEVVDYRGAAPVSRTVFEGSFAPRALVDFQIKL